MKYGVLNENNVYKVVSDEDIEENIKSGEPLKRTTVQAMGKSHNEKYLPLLYPVLYHEDIFMRLDAARSILFLNGKEGLNQLKERERSIGSEGFQEEPCEKGVLEAIILRIEEGTEGVINYFLSDDGIEAVKYCLLVYYRSGYIFQEEDIDLCCVILAEFLKREASWIKKLSKSDYNSFVYFALDGLMVAGKESDVMKNMNNDLSEKLLQIISEVMAQKPSGDTKEVIAMISIGVEEIYGKEILRLLRGKVSGDARRAYKKALRYWNLTEEML